MIGVQGITSRESLITDCSILQFRWLKQLCSNQLCVRIMDLNEQPFYWVFVYFSHFQVGIDQNEVLDFVNQYEECETQRSASLSRGSSVDNRLVILEKTNSIELEKDRAITVTVRKTVNELLSAVDEGRDVLLPKPKLDGKTHNFFQVSRSIQKLLLEYSKEPETLEEPDVLDKIAEVRNE